MSTQGGFKIGQRVRCKYSGNVFDAYGFKVYGETGVVGFGGVPEYVYVMWDNPRLREHFNKGGNISHGGGWHPDDFESAGIPVDLTRPVKCRNGGTVTVTRVDDKDRPYRATVKGIELSFDEYGNFVPGQECPIDLVNT